jgi:UDP-3-O-[3-hydroxymyristoyl] glucosamine N-acyltransferase
LDKATTWTLGELAKTFGGELVGPAEMEIRRPAPSHEMVADGLSFAESEAYLATAEATGVGAVLIDRELREPTIPFIRVDHPRAAFGQFLTMAQRPLPLEKSIHPTAVVSPEATIGEGVSVGPYSVVERGAVLGDGVKVYPHCYVGENCHLGAGTVLYPHVTLYQDVTLGAKCIIHSGTVLGADGFGYVWTGQHHHKVPQVGGVELGDQVEIGSNTSVDRATAGTTRIGSGTKIDNLVQVGHNVKIGKNTVIAGMSGVPGSVTIGDRVIVGGAVVINDHTTICDDVVLGGRSGVDRDITEPGQYFGTPARPVAEALRAMLLVPKLPEMMSRIRQLEKKVKD